MRGLLVLLLIAMSSCASDQLTELKLELSLDEEILARLGSGGTVTLNAPDLQLTSRVLDLQSGGPWSLVFFQDSGDSAPVKVIIEGTRGDEVVFRRKEFIQLKHESQQTFAVHIDARCADVLCGFCDANREAEFTCRQGQCYKLLQPDEPAFGQQAPDARSLSCFQCENQNQIPEAECNALVEFFYATNGGEWKSYNDWLVNDKPCSWQFVDCDAGHVVDVAFVHNEDNDQRGHLPESFGDLEHLRYLRLNDTSKMHGPLPESIGKLSKLETIFIYDSGIGGPLPASIANWTAAKHIDFNNSNFSGSIEVFGSMPNLKSLQIRGNDFSGAIPASLMSLDELKMRDNGCFTASDDMKEWLDAFDSKWNDGCN